MASAQKRFGTFSGVFVPNVLTIFGVILFYREGWLVGNTGLLGAIIIICLANLITISTSLSLSAIVTNIRVKGGGAYYLVSRSLGPEMGGAIGITLFFAQAFSIAFYVIGFSKAIGPFFPGISPEILNTVTLLLLTLLSIFSAEIAIKAQYLIFALVMVALGSFMLGKLPGGEGAVLYSADFLPTGQGFFNTIFTGPAPFSIKPALFGMFKDADFWKSFAIFFPAVTGIFAGLSLSGDLKEPNKNIPKGTILAIVFTFIFYILIAVWFAFNFTPADLMGNEKLMLTSASVPLFVFLGICAATLSSAIGVLLGAPRTLQALAQDEIVPRIFGRGSGATNEPRTAMLLSVVLAEGLLLVGGSNMNFVSQLLTMFFLSSYGIINFIAALEVIIGNPAYRPKFRVHWLISLSGAFGSFAIMFLIDQSATIIALLIIFVTYFVYARKGLEKEWGDIRKGFWASVIEIALANYEKYEAHPRNWRPHIAIFENDCRSRKALTTLATQIVGKNGLVSDYVFINDYLHNGAERAENELKELKEFLRENSMPIIYPEIVMTNKDKNSHLITLQADGIGSFKANTIISDFYLDNKSLEHHFANLNNYEQLKKNVILLKHHDKDDLFADRIDIWLSGFKANISMMLLIPFLLTKSVDWSKTRICLRMIVGTRDLKERAEKNIQAILTSARINAEVDIYHLHESSHVVIHDPQKEQRKKKKEHTQKRSNIFTRLISFLGTMEQSKYDDKDRIRIKEIIKEESRDARLVVLGLSVPAQGKENNYAQDVNALVKDLPATILVRGNYNINLFK